MLVQPFSYKRKHIAFSIGCIPNPMSRNPSEDYLKNKGYTADEIGILKNDRPLGKWKVLIDVRGIISYPLDEDEIRTNMERNGTEYCIVTGEDVMHIFRLSGGTIEEIQDIPDNLETAQEPNAADCLNEMFSRIISETRKLGSDDVPMILALLIHIGQNGLWNSLAEDPDSTVHKAISDLNLDLRIRNPKKLAKVFLPCRDTDLSPSDALIQSFGDVCKQINPELYDTLPGILTKNLIGPGTVGFYSGYGIGLASSVLAVKDRSSYWAATEMSQMLITVLTGIAEDKCHTGYSIGGTYDNIVMQMPLGVRPWHADGRYPVSGKSGLSHEILLEESLDHLNGGGRVITFVPTTFLYDPHSEDVRRMLAETYHISALIELEKAPKQSLAVSLIVVTKESPGPTLVCRETVVAENYGSLTAVLTSYFKNGTVTEPFLLTNLKNHDDWDIDSITKDRTHAMLLGKCCSMKPGNDVGEEEVFQTGTKAGFPYVRVEDIRNGSADTADCLRIPARCVRDIAEEGDLVLGISDDDIVCAKVGLTKFMPSGGLIILHPNEGLDAGALLDLLNSERVKKQLRKCIGSDGKFRIGELGKTILDR